MKFSSLFLAGVLLLSAEATDSCGREKPNARTNPDSNTPNCAKADSLGCRQLAPAPAPEYSASQPALEYEESLRRREDESARQYSEARK